MLSLIFFYLVIFILKLRSFHIVHFKYIVGIYFIFTFPLFLKLPLSLKFTLHFPFSPWYPSCYDSYSPSPTPSLLLPPSFSSLSSDSDCYLLLCKWSTCVHDRENVLALLIFLIDQYKVTLFFNYFIIRMIFYPYNFLHETCQRQTKRL